MANLWHSWFTRIGFAALHFDQNLGLWRHLWLLWPQWPLTYLSFSIEALRCIHGRKTFLELICNHIYGVSVNSHFCHTNNHFCDILDIGIITEHTYWKRTSCSSLLPSWANERLCALGAGAQLFKLSNPVDRQTREKGPNCDSSPPLH